MSGKRHTSHEHQNTERWAVTYADLMNNLLVLFIVLYITSVVDMQKFETLASSFSKTLLGNAPISETSRESTTAEELTDIINSIDLNALSTDEVSVVPTPDPSSESVLPPGASPTPEPTLPPGATPTPEFSLPPGATPTPDSSGLEPLPSPPSNAQLGSVQEQYNELFIRITSYLQDSGYDSQVAVEKMDDHIYLRFREGIFFYPDSSVLKQTAYPVLSSISDIVLDSYDLVANIDISGHTARVSKDPPTKANLFSWELSTDRALTVLKFLVQECDVPQEKLSVTGYSCNQLYVEGDSEEQMAQNRRVEIRLSQKVAN